MFCEKCENVMSLELHEMRLIPEGKDPLELKAVEIHCCWKCRMFTPTRMEIIRLMQALGVHPESHLPFPVKVYILGGKEVA